MRDLAVVMAMTASKKLSTDSTQTATSSWRVSEKADRKKRPECLEENATKMISTFVA